MFYSNLVQEMERNQVKHGDIARVIGVNEIVASLKINAFLSFTLAEAVKIRSQLFPDTNIDYLFRASEMQLQ
jgi:hypothetical protein